MRAQAENQELKLKVAFFETIAQKTMVLCIWVSS